MSRVLLLVAGILCTTACSSQRRVESAQCIALETRRSEKETNETNERVAQMLINFARKYRMSVDFGHGVEVNVGFNRERKNLLSMSFRRITKSSRGEVRAFYLTPDSEHITVFVERIGILFLEIQKSMKGKACSEIPGYIPGVLFLPS